MNPETDIDAGLDASGLFDRLERVVEALVFAADAPLPAERIAEVYHRVTGLDDVDAARVAEAVERINAELEAAGRALRIERWAGGYRMATAPELAPFVRGMVEEARRRPLSRSLMETLAIVAYRQPITKPEVDFVRGVDAGYAINRLLEMTLLDVVGRSDGPGRPLLYGTTELFLETFGLDTLDDLPTLREIESLLADPSFDRERAKLLFELGGVARPAGEGAEETTDGAEPAPADRVDASPNDPETTDDEAE